MQEKVKKKGQGNADSGIQEIFSSGIRDPGNFACGISGIPLKESGIPRTFSVRNLSSNDKESKSSEWNP